MFLYIATDCFIQGFNDCNYEKQSIASWRSKKGETEKDHKY